MEYMSTDRYWYSADAKWQYVRWEVLGTPDNMWVEDAELIVLVSGQAHKFSYADGEKAQAALLRLVGELHEALAYAESESSDEEAEEDDEAEDSGEDGDDEDD